MPDEVDAEPAAGLGDPAVGGQLDQVGGLVLVEVVSLHQPELHRRGRDALLEVGGVEAEAIAQEFDDVVVAREVVGLCHGPNIAPR